MPNHRPHQKRSKELSEWSLPSGLQQSLGSWGPPPLIGLRGHLPSQLGPRWGVGGQGRKVVASSVSKPCKLSSIPTPPEDPVTASEWPEVTHSPAFPQTSRLTQSQGARRGGWAAGRHSSLLYLIFRGSLAEKRGLNLPIGT